MTKPRLLDLFCGGGGAAMGYARAGFEVVGVDIKPQPHYPFEFHQGDALEVLELVHPQGNWPLGRFDAIHASPPCQAYTWGTRKGREDRFPRLIGDTRSRLVETNLPYVIENVERAKRVLREPILLCGSMFMLGVNRHRLFETHWRVQPWLLPGHPRCSGRISRNEAVTVAGHGGDSRDFRIARWREAMGIDWMTKAELVEAIPPAYTEWIGRQLLAAIERAA